MCSQLQRTLHSIEALTCFKFLESKLKDLEYSQQPDEDKNNFKGVILTISPIKVSHIEMVECKEFDRKRNKFWSGYALIWLRLPRL